MGAWHCNCGSHGRDAVAGENAAASSTPEISYDTSDAICMPESKASTEAADGGAAGSLDKTLDPAGPIKEQAARLPQGAPQLQLAPQTQALPQFGIPSSAPHLLPTEAGDLQRRERAACEPEVTERQSMGEFISRVKSDAGAMALQEKTKEAMAALESMSPKMPNGSSRQGRSETRQRSLNRAGTPRPDDITEITRHTSGRSTVSSLHSVAEVQIAEEDEDASREGGSKGPELEDKRKRRPSWFSLRKKPHA